MPSLYIRLPKQEVVVILPCYTGELSCDVLNVSSYLYANIINYSRIFVGFTLMFCHLYLLF